MKAKTSRSKANTAEGRAGGKMAFMASNIPVRKLLTFSLFTLLTVRRWREYEDVEVPTKLYFHPAPVCYPAPVTLDIVQTTIY